MICFPDSSDYRYNPRCKCLWLQSFAWRRRRSLSPGRLRRDPGRARSLAYVLRRHVHVARLVVRLGCPFRP